MDGHKDAVSALLEQKVEEMLMLNFITPMEVMMLVFGKLTHPIGALAVVEKLLAILDQIFNAQSRYLDGEVTHGNIGLPVANVDAVVKLDLFTISSYFK